MMFFGNVASKTQPLGTRHIQGVRSSNGGGTIRKTGSPALGTDTLSLAKNKTGKKSKAMELQAVRDAIKYLKERGGELETFLMELRRVEDQFEEHRQQGKADLLERFYSGMDMDEATEGFFGHRYAAELDFEIGIKHAIKDAKQRLFEARRHPKPIRSTDQKPHLTWFGAVIRSVGSFAQEAQRAASRGGILGLGQHLAAQAANLVKSGADALGNAATAILKKLWPW